MTEPVCELCKVEPGEVHFTYLLPPGVKFDRGASTKDRVFEASICYSCLLRHTSEEVVSKIGQERIQAARSLAQ